MGRIKRIYFDLMIYTTPDRIARILRGRLELSTTASGVPFGSSFGAKEVDLDLLDQKGSQIEAQVNSILTFVYELPIPSNARDALQIISSIVEDLTVASLAVVHFQQMQNPQMGGDMGFGAILYRNALYTLRQYVAGYQLDFNIPGLPPPMANPMMPTQTLKLPGVKLKVLTPGTYTRQTTIVTQKNPCPADKINWS